MISEEIRYLREEAFALSEKYEQLKQRNAVLERALDWLGEVAEGKRECGGYPAVNWAKSAAEEELGREKE